MAVDFPACVAFQIDVGFGDAVTPAPGTIEIPTIIDLPTPTLWAYAAETVIAERAIAMVERGILNTRLRLLSIRSDLANFGLPPLDRPFRSERRTGHHPLGRLLQRQAGHLLRITRPGGSGFS